MTIPEQAVKAAISGYASSKQHTFDGQIHDALTAAAPHMWYKREFNISSCTVDLSGADYKRFLDGVTGFEVSLDEETRSFGEYNEGDRVFLDVKTGKLDAHQLFILSRPAFEKKVQERISALPHMSGVKVKQLEWIEKSNDAYAHSDVGYYEINETRLGFCVSRNTFLVSKDIFETLEAAKDAAQADYEKRFWAMADVTALEPPSQSRKPLPSELIRAYVEDYEWRTDSGDYTPNNTERAMIEDAIAGYAGYVDEVLASSAREQALDLSVLERLAKIADEYDEPDENGPFPDIQDAMISIRDLRQIRKLLAAIRALKSQPAQTGGGE